MHFDTGLLQRTSESGLKSYFCLHLKSLALLCLLFNLGCGGGDESDSQSATTLADQFEEANRKSDAEEKTRQLLKITRTAREEGDIKVEELAIAAAARACITISSPSDRAMLTTQVAEQLVESKQRSEALKLLSEIESSTGYIDAPIDQVQVASEIAPILSESLGKKDSAIKLLDQASKTSETISDPLFRVRAQAQLIDSYGMLNQVESIVDLYSQAKQFSESLPELRTQAEALAYLVVAAQTHSSTLENHPTATPEAVVQILNQISDPGEKTFAIGGVFKVWFSDSSEATQTSLRSYRPQLVELGKAAFGQIENPEVRNDLSETMQLLK